ncbi:MAG: hypothetical protein ACM3X0_07310 [Bacteroidota bacterium]
MVSTTSQTATYPDGSATTTTTTTTTDPNTGATNTTGSKTTTGAGGSGTTAGQAGPVGTTSTSGDQSNTKGTGNEKTPKDQQGDCTLEPNAPFCQPFTDPGTDGLYKKKSDQLDKPLTDFANTIRNSALGKAPTGFFAVTVPGGSCPGMSAYVPYLNVTIDLAPYICSGTAASVMDIVGTVVLFIAAYKAFLIAFL